MGSAGDLLPFVKVPVPAPYVVRVMALIVELTEGSAAGTSGSPGLPPGEASTPGSEAEEALVAEGAAEAGAERRWTIDELRRLAEGTTFTTKVLTEILDVLLESPGEWLTSGELAARTGRDAETIKRIWTHVSRHVNRHYAGLPWPLEAQWGAAFDPVRAPLVYYRLNEDQAREWQLAREKSAS